MVAKIEGKIWDTLSWAMSQGMWQKRVKREWEAEGQRGQRGQAKGGHRLRANPKALLVLSSHSHTQYKASTRTTSLREHLVNPFAPQAIVGSSYTCNIILLSLADSLLPFYSIPILCAPTLNVHRTTSNI